MDEQVEITYRPRGTTQENKLRVRHVLSCTGPQSDYRKLNDPLVQQLLVRDLLAPDPLRIGAYSAEGGYICNREGQVTAAFTPWAALKKGDFTSQLPFQNCVGRLPISPHTSSPRPLRDCGKSRRAKAIRYLQ